MGARETALNALIACRKSGAWPNGALKEYIARDRLSPRDAALAARLCYGVLQNRNKLDFYLKQLLTGRLKDLHPVVRDILHLGLYQIYELDKVPESAAVNESVTLAKKYCKNPKAGALVNAVLRKAATKGTLQEPVSYADRYSHPDELISLLKANLPKGKLEPMLIADNAAPQTVVQVNTLRTSAEKLAERLTAEHVCVKPHEWMADCLVLSGTGSLELLPAFREGLFYEARYHGEPVCVFVGKDDAGKAKFACMRSIIGSLKKDVYGSDKEYSFCYPPHNPGSRHVAVFEAPIDALSHATLQELEGWKWDGYRLSLGGTSHVALAAFLERHPEIRRVNLYMDNDLGGLKNARKIKAMLHENPRFKHIRVGINPPRSGKDYNEKLLNVREQSKEHQRQCRQKQAAISI